jgi:hypothetical protein
MWTDTPKEDFTMNTETPFESIHTEGRYDHSQLPGFHSSQLQFFFTRNHFSNKMEEFHNTKKVYRHFAFGKTGNSQTKIHVSNFFIKRFQISSIKKIEL